ncbi:MAG: GNAT family N-acetyltransferase [Bacteroidetes bacterium]|nr:GNAT family N-acetyltransferase [Bacteroidota bacterium]
MSEKIIKVNELVKLKQIALSDANDVFQAIDSQREYLGEWLTFVATTIEMSDTEKFIQSILDLPEENRDLIFVIHYKGKFVGLIGLKDIDRLNNKTEIGYWLSENYQKKGIITQSVKLLINFAFDELNINRIQIKCAVGNFPSKSIPQKLNFKLEGIERDGELLTGNIYTDLEVYCKLKKNRN